MWIFAKLKLNTGRRGRIFFSKAMGSSMVDIKADKAYEGSAIYLTRFWAYISYGTKARIK